MKKKPDPRLQLMLRMKKDGLNIQDIADVFGISRQRVLQLADKTLPEERDLFRRPPRKYANKVCPHCKGNFTANAAQYRVYCSRKCAVDSHRKYPTPKERDLSYNERKRWLYNNVPEFKARVRKRMDEYMDRVRANPVKNEKRLRRMRTYMKKYNAARRNQS
jgi:hypothetical protein